MKPGAFFPKLQELAQDYEKIQDFLNLNPPLDRNTLQSELQRLTKSCEDLNASMNDYICSGRSPAVSALTEIQKNYYLSVKNMAEKQLPLYIRSACNSPQEALEEARALYAEYAIDFARQSINYALLSVLAAMDPQIICKE